ncbi:MAG: ATP-binding cassette domain-containing protein [Desulfobacteraceae bacterium]|nr:ATP-binding cassette domain-containing protein [Desulfobacteraceae bacterium]MBU4037279.1 ATP-binding cassette domain-containing protein [Pseudomonadota bacterium]
MINPSKTKRLIGETEDPVIMVERVSKKFCSNLKRSMAYGIIDLSKNLAGVKTTSNSLRKNEFWAVDDVSFTLKKGEVLGLIGENGSGKSSLLRLVAGIMPPDKGRITIRGRVGALIAVGAGFHPHMSGRENVFLNGTIMGMTRDEIKSKYQEIVDFAQIDEFIDAPVSTYSSGMRVRLGFAVAVHMDPDLMLIDEVLAVGDFNFRQKCSEKINDIRRKSAIILVSHNIRDILMLCSKTMVMNKGKVTFLGGTRDAVDFYLEQTNKKDADRENNRKDAKRVSTVSLLYGELFDNRNKIAEVSHQWVDRAGKTVSSIPHGSRIIMQFSFRVLYPVDNLIVGVPIFGRGDMISAMNTDVDGIRICVGADGYVQGSLEIDYLAFNPGRYVSVFAVVDANEFLYRNVIGEFVIGNLPVAYGSVTLKHLWRFEKV